MTIGLPARIRRVCHSYRLLPVILTLSGVPAMAAAQTTVVLDAPGSEVNADTTIRSGGYATVNYSTSDRLESKISGENTTRRILLKFDTQNHVPAGTVISSAKLSVVLKEAADSASRPIGAYRITQSFSGPEVNWLDKQAATLWATKGGSLGEKFATTYVGNSVGSTYTFDVTQLVQRAVSGEFGSRYTRIALVDTGGISTSSYRAFHSSRASNTAVRPKLVVTYGAPSSLATTTTSGGSIRVMQWNIHKTMGTDGRCDPGRIVDWVAKLAPQIVSMNEVSYYSGTCSYNADQGANLQALLQSKTGQTWHRKYVNGNGGSSGLGNLILSRLPFTSTSTYLLSYGRGVVQVGVVVNGRNVNLFSTHVDYYNSSYRTEQTNQAKSWMSNFAAPRIALGDFNTWPDTSDYYIMANKYGDAWAVAKSGGTASAYNGTGATQGSSRLDYVYYSKVTQLVLKSVTVADTGSASDHSPVIATFSVQ